MNTITKDIILHKTNSYEILNHYLKPYHNKHNLKQGENISNPFLSEKQKTPSFNIYVALPSHEWRYKDFATGEDGSCFDLVINLFHIDFSAALKKIAVDFGINYSQNKNIETKTYNIKRRDFTESEFQFWSKYGITKEVLTQFKVVTLSEYSFKSKDDKMLTFKSNSDKFIFAYENDSWTKLYKPLDEKQYKFQYLGAKEPNFIFGWKQLPEKGEMLFITGGEKDVMSLASKGFNAISLNSETANIDEVKLNELKQRFKKIIVLYDNDQTGITQSIKLSQIHKLCRIELPPISNNGKDISDFLKESGSIENLLESLITEDNNNLLEDANEKVVYNALELMNIGNIEPKYLMQPIFPQKGTAVVAGKPDTGKSQFARELCIHIACGIDTFIGFNLTVKHGKSMYVATEDNLEATTFLLSKQLKGLNKEAQENLRFVFADTMTQEEILTAIDSQLTIEPVDLVVVDSFGDIFKGGDSNNNMAMRNTVKEFDKIAKKHDCLILFVHHINKGAYRQAPGQEHIQGGAGLVQKVRLAIQLTEGEGNKRYFTVVKGNYCPKEYKQNSLELLFSEDTFLFTNTGNMIATADLGQTPEKNTKEDKIDRLNELAEAILKNCMLNHSSFVKRYCEITNQSVPTAKRAVKSMLELDIIEKCNGVYRLNNVDETSEIEFLDTNENEGMPF